MSALASFGLALALLCAAHASAHAQTAIGLGATLFFDSGTLENDERIGPLHDVTRDDITNPRLAAGALSFLYALGDGTPRDGFRLGGEFRYMGGYAVERGDGNGNDNRTDLGTLMELGFRGEWSTELLPRFGLSFGLRADLGILVPGGDFADEIDRLADEGVPTGQGPRVGLSLIPMVGARYELHERVHVRLDLGLGWTMIDLFGIDDTVQGIAYTRDETVSATRFEVTIGFELSL
ncbi:MAG: hypothetical protein U1F43_19130 [Myxococcota bacterium]